jgi:acyl-CoA synthetase (NDP forming)
MSNEWKKKSLYKLFHPKSVAIVGASNNPGKWGYAIVRNLLRGDFPGKIYPINRTDSTVLGLKAFPKLTDVEREVDLTIVIIPSRGVSALLPDIEAVGCKNAVVISSNFREAGAEGKKLEDEMTRIAENMQLNLVGPNTMGILSLPQNLHCAWIPQVPLPGKVAMISQSGNLGNQLLDWGLREGIGFSRYVGSGNEAVLKTYDYLEFFAEDPETEVIAMYIEGVDDGRKLLEVARRVSREKPIVVVKGGRTATGSRAVSSHTGAMTGRSEVFFAALRQAGVVIAESSQQLVNVTRGFTRMPLPKGNRVGIMTLGGGWGVVAADACAEAGLELPLLTPKASKAINKELPEFWSKNNPVDLVGSFKRKGHLRILRSLIKDDEYDAVINLGVIMSKKFGTRNIADGINGWFNIMTRDLTMPFGYTFSLTKGMLKSLGIIDNKKKKSKKGGKKEKTVKSTSVIDLSEIMILADTVFAEKTAELVRDYHKPIFSVQFHPDKIDKLMTMKDFVCYDTPEKAVTVLSKMVGYSLWRQAVEPEGTSRKELSRLKVNRKAVEEIIAERSGALSEIESRNILAAYGIPVPAGEVATSATGAIKIAKKIGFPVVAKIASPDILHKTEAGGIRLGLESEKQVSQAFSEIIAAAKKYDAKAKIDGVLISAMAAAGTEVICGGTCDEQFGPVIATGLGGVFTEVLKDISISVSPFSRQTALAAIESIKSYPMLTGFRGAPVADVAKIIDVMMRVQKLLLDFEDRIAELDVNPLFVYPKGKGVMAADALIVLK